MRSLYAAILLALGLLVASQTRAHEWYSSWCCDGNDCAPYHGVVEETPGGYYLPQYKITVPYDKRHGDPTSAHPAVQNGARYDMPGDDPYEFHLCEFPIGSGIVRCFYAKQGGV